MRNPKFLSVPLEESRDRKKVWLAARAGDILLDNRLSCGVTEIFVSVYSFALRLEFQPQIQRNSSLLVTNVCDFSAVNGYLFCLQCACTESHRCMKLEKNKDAQEKVQGHQLWMEAKLLTKIRHSWQIPSLLPTPPLPPTYPPHLAKPHWDDNNWARQDLLVVARSPNSRIFRCVGQGNRIPDPACCNVLKNKNNKKIWRKKF